MIRSFLISVALLIVLSTLGLAALPFLVSSQVVREQVANQISELTGRAVSLRGDRTLRMFPSLSVELSDVVIEGDLPEADQPLIVAETLRGAVRPFPLLFGRIELSSFELTRPTIRLFRNAEGDANWRLSGSDLEDAFEPTRVAGAGLQLGRFRILDGTLRLTDEMRGIDEQISSATLTLAWPTSSTRMAINGEAIWRGEAVTITASIDQPAALGQIGSTSGVVLSLASTPLDLRFDGTISPGGRGQNAPPWQAAGALDVSTPSLRRTANWFGQSIEPGSTFGALQIESHVNLVGLTVDLTDAQLSLDGNHAEGVLTVDWDGYHNEDRATANPSIQGTLDFERLDLSPYFALLEPTTTAATPADWRFLPLPDVFSIPLDLDLRFAARELEAAGLIFGETGGSILLAPDQLVLGIAEAAAFGGQLDGTLIFQPSPVGMTMTAEMSATTLAVNEPIQALVDMNAPRGLLDGRFALQAEGQSLGDFVANLKGAGQVELVQGAFFGVDLDQISAILADGEIADGALPIGGNTTFDRFVTDLSVESGRVTFNEGSVQSDSLDVSFGGQTSLVDQSLRLIGTANAGPSDQPLVTPFAIGGHWTSPELMSSDRSF